jgi:hypothetical protein
MLLYPLQEAIDLLSSKLSGAKTNLEETIEDLEWLREQVTVMEVNFARVHNVSTARGAVLILSGMSSGMSRVDGHGDARVLMS